MRSQKKKTTTTNNSQSLLLSPRGAERGVGWWLGGHFPTPGLFPCFWHARGFLSEYSYTEDITGKKADCIICQGQVVLKACSRFYACISSLPIKPELRNSELSTWINVFLVSVENVKMFQNRSIRLCDQLKMLQCWRRTGPLPSFFVTTPRNVTPQDSPPPGICNWRQKNTKARAGALCSWNWLTHYRFNSKRIRKK